MNEIRTIFSDIGGVIGTNGWDHHERRAAVEKFGLDLEEFESRHEMVVTAFETGQLSLDCYLERTVFYRQRPFTREAFRSFMMAQSHADPDSLAVLERVSRTGQYLLSTLNNESLELNQHRIETFGLRKIFKLFLSSCFLGVLKPDQAFYQLALKLTQQDARHCVFIDDRALNAECAAREGMQTIQFKNAAQLESDLGVLGVRFD